jgi:ribose transport system substrate-binding protein
MPAIHRARLSRRSFSVIASAAVIAATLGAPAPSMAAGETIPIIVKDTTSFFWQIVLAGARKAGKDLGVNVPELGAQ